MEDRACRLSPDADRALVLMGSACGAAESLVEALCAAGERVGLVQVSWPEPWNAIASGPWE